LIAAAAGVVIGGVLASTLASHAIVGSDAQRSHQAFVSSAAEIALTMQKSIQHEQDLTVSASAFVVGNDNAAQTQFRQWTTAVHAFDRYPELQAIGEIELVSAAGLPAFTARVHGSSAAPLPITPPGIRPYYCLEVLSAARPGQSTLPIGVDYCRTVAGPLLIGSRDSGVPSYIPFTVGSTTTLAVGTPIYSQGVTPQTVSARRATFLGWTGAQFDPDVLLHQALLGHPDEAVSFHFHEGSYTATFHAGSVHGSGQSATVDLTPSWTVTTSAPPFSGGLLAHQNATIVLLGGLALSLMLGVLIFVMGSSRSRALALVNSRTDELHFLAYHDALTGLPNRALILDRLAQMMARTQRQGGPVTVLLVNVDAFRDVNDTMGHDVGDDILIELGRRLSAGLRKSDSVGRLAGDEFVILVEGGLADDAPDELAGRVLELTAPPFAATGDSRGIDVAVSIGIALGSRAQPEDLLRDAGIALCHAKTDGPRAVVFSTAMHDDVDHRRSLELSLHGALAAGEFFVLYQPTVDLTTQRFTGAEALLRWNHRDRGVVGPDEFIPLLEANGLIVPVGAWVLEEACRQGARWADQGHPLMMSVNVSARQLEGSQLVDDVTAALASSGLDPGLLILELTETALMRDVQTTVDQLLLLKEHGVRIAIDDFGTGYSSLAYLSQFPIDVLKIDQSFVSGLTDRPEAAAIVHTLVQLGKLLGLETTAEGIETHDQWKMLQDEDVDNGQGYLFARPQSAAAIDLLLNVVGGAVDHALLLR
jgi:diguanylate cyclase (GGDEF)-like protein